jgi:F-type H+-transporting ATPase subunit a
MTGLSTETELQWSLADFFGYKHSFLFINAETVVYTWLMLLVMAIIIGTIRIILIRDSLARYAVLSLIEALMDMVTQALGTFSFGHFAFIGALFCFILLANTISIIPWLDEPTKDINTTLALGIISFMYIQAASIKQNGLIAYIKDYFSPFFILFPLNVIGKMASIISLSFRLFGNIFAGSIIATMWMSAIRGSLIAEIIGIPFNLVIMIFFGIFEGFLQAFVFTMLSLTYLSLALQGEGH